MKLSILDQSPMLKESSAKEALEATIDLAQAADRWGYTRYWTAEHHDLSGLASPAPDIMLGIIGSKTERIRIGSGAVLLPNYQPYNIAERYNLLSTLYPGRVDTGIGRTPGGSAEVSIALAGNFLEKVKKYPDLVDEFNHFIKQDFPADHLYSKITAAPVPEESPVPWLLGTSDKSAILAAEKGMRYVFGDFRSSQDGAAIIQQYRENFTGHTPEVFAAVPVICAETTEQAEELALSNGLWSVLQSKMEGHVGIPPVEDAKTYNYSEDDREKMEKAKTQQIIGNPEEVKERLETLQERYQIDEFMILTIAPSYETRKKSYQLLAEVFDLNVAN